MHEMHGMRGFDHDWSPGFGHGPGPGPGIGGGPGMLLSALDTLFWVALSILLVWIVLRWLLPYIVSLFPIGNVDGPKPASERPSALEILRERYAAGEIDAVSFEQMRERLEASYPQRE